MTWLRTFLAVLSLTLLTGAAPPRAPMRDEVDAVARDYVQLVLELGERDSGYVDAYYGPPEWRVAARAHPRTIAELVAAVSALQRRLEALPATLSNPRASADRRRFLSAQLFAAATRLRMLQGERLSFREEAQGLYGVEPRISELGAFDPVLARMDRLVPGEGPLEARVNGFMNRFIIPRDRLDAVMRAAIAECRRRTVAHIPVTPGENFTLEFVTRRSWSGYNWYQGDYRSLIQVNIDQAVRMGRVIDLGCHEGYPGHHLFNMLLERRLTRGRGWIEYSVYPLYSPQSFIAEGTATYGVELAFPGGERLEFERRVLYPMAGLPADRAEVYLELEKAMRELSGSRFAIARDLLEGRIDRERAITLTERYGLQNRARAEQTVAFIEQYRSYVINYGLGRDLVAAYIERGRATGARWDLLRDLLSRPSLPADLQPNDS